MTPEEQQELDFVKAAAEQATRRADMWSKIANLWKLFGTEVRTNPDYELLVDQARAREDEIVKEYGT